MKSPALTFLLLTTLFSTVQAVQESPPAPAPVQANDHDAISPEARACFEWFDTLGYPDMRQAKWAEIHIGREVQRSGEVPEPGTIGAFVLRDDGTCFDAMLADLSPVKLQTTVPERKPWGVYYEEKSFTAYLDRLIEQKTGDEYMSRSLIQDWVMTRKARMFFMSYVAWKQGYPSSAQWLFDTAAHWQTSNTYTKGMPPSPATMRADLEWELGNGLMLRALQKFGGRDEYSPILRLAPRTEVLTMLRSLLRHHPRSGHVETAKKLVLILEQAEQDAGDRVGTSTELQSLPLEARIKELILRLRDTSWSHYVPPAGLVVEARLRKDENNPASALKNIGRPAVPQLIQALQDFSYTRSLRIERGSFYIATVSELCESLLSEMTGMRLHATHPDVRYPTNASQAEKIRLNAEYWLRETTFQGEAGFLAREIASGNRLSETQVMRLKELNPQMAIAAIMLGATNSEKFSKTQDYLRSVGEIPSEEATRFLVRQMGQTTSQYGWQTVATALWNRGHPAALPAIIDTWQALPLRLKDSHRDQFEAIIQILAGTKDPQAVSLLLKGWSQRPARRRLRILQVLDGAFSAGITGRQVNGIVVRAASPEVRATVDRFLVEALDDTDGSAGYSGTMMKFNYLYPRVCDMALNALHNISPDEYPYTNRCDRRQRDKEILQAKQHWSRNHGSPETSRSFGTAPSPFLPADDSLEITKINCLLGDHAEWRALKDRVESLKGQKFAPEMLLEIALDYANSSFVNSSNLSVEAVRSRDLTGVTLNLQMRPGMPLEGMELTQVVSGELNGKSLSGINDSISLPDAQDKASWTHLADKLRPILTAPPDADFVLRICLFPKE